MTTGPPGHSVREALAALRDVRDLVLILPEAALSRALDFATHAAKAANLTIEEAIARYDPDPRIPALECATLSETLADLDETERYLAVRITHSMRARAAKTLATQPELEPTIWAIAHDRAIVEVAAARAAAERNGGIE